MSFNSKDLPIPSSQSLLLFSNLTSFPTHTPQHTLHATTIFKPQASLPLETQGPFWLPTDPRRPCLPRGDLSLGPNGFDHGRGHVGLGRRPAPRWGGAPRPRGGSTNKGRGAARGARGLREPSCGWRGAGWRGESGVLTEVSSRYTSGYWKDSMAGAGRGLKVGIAGEAGRGLRRRAACEPASGRAESWRAGVHGRTHCGAVRQAGRRCGPGREPLPGGRAQAAARGSGVGARAPERAHSSLCRSASRARAHGGARWRRRATPLGDRPPAAPHYPAFPPFTPGKGNFASSLS